MDYDLEIIIGAPMRPTMQSRPGTERQVWSTDPDDVGDCFPACVASLLNAPIGDVPHFTAQRNLAEYLAGIELPYHDVQLAREWLRTMDLDLGATRASGIAGWDCHYIATVESQRFVGKYHAVICYQGEIVHDPAGTGRDYTVVEDLAYVLVRPYDPDPPTLSRYWRSTMKADR